MIGRRPDNLATRRRRAVTLLEVILAMGLLGFVSGMTYWFYASSLETNRTGTDAARKLRLTRSILDRMAKEIRQAAFIQAENHVGIAGDAEQIFLSTYRVPTRAQTEERRYRDEPPPPEYDLMTIEYRIVRHPEIEHPDGYEFPLGLARVERPVPRALPPLTEDERAALEEQEAEEDGNRFLDEGSEAPPGEGDAEGTGNRNDNSGLDHPPNAGRDMGGFSLDELLGREGARGDATGDPTLGPDIRWDELYAPEIRYLRFCYYDGNRWWDTWQVQGESPLPQLVHVTVGFEPQPPFGEESLGLGEIAEINEEFCTCREEDPVDCRPLREDQYSIVVRVPQSDPLFRSRITRETQSLAEELSEGQAGAPADGTGAGGPPP